MQRALLCCEVALNPATGERDPANITVNVVPCQPEQLSPTGAGENDESNSGEEAPAVVMVGHSTWQRTTLDAAFEAIESADPGRVPAARTRDYALAN